MPLITKPAFAALLASRARPRTLPRQLPPDRIRESYTAALQGIMSWVMERTRAEIVPQLEALAAAASRVATTDASNTDKLGDAIDKLRAEFDRRYSRQRLRGLVQPYAERTATFQATQLNRQMRAAVALDVVGSEPWLGAAVEDFVRENVALIKTIPSRYFDEIETLVSREAADGARWETMVKGIEDRYDVSRSRAKIIARDQVGKFYADLNRVRQSDLGISRFVWRTMRDNRVRPEHEELDGQSFTWGNAPDGGPGEAVLCRCYADPDLSSVKGMGPND